MKIICIGRNYALHAKELGNDIPEEPVIFLKPDTAILKDNLPFYIPSNLGSIHHELEIIVKINKPGKKIAKNFASKYYSEVSIGIDFTAREKQNWLKSKGLPWELAKSFDNSAIIGKWISKENLDIKNLNIELIKSGKSVQKGNSNQMLNDIDDIISFVSQYFTLKTGDIIFTGTPEGVGEVQIGDQLKGYLNGQELFNFEVK